MESVEEQPPPLKRIKVSSGGRTRLRRIMDGAQEVEGGNDFIGSKGVIRKVEFVRIIAEALQSLGYNKTVESLEGESGICLHTHVVTLFIKQVLDGSWSESVKTLGKIGVLDEETVKRASVMIFERRFFELMDENKDKEALEALRFERERLSISHDRVTELSACIVFRDRCPVVGAYGKDTSKQKLRLELLVKLQRVFPPSVWIAKERLLHLLEQNIEFQRDTCRLHNTGVEEMSLMADHCCGTDKLPTHTLQILQGHTNEVWFVQFSHDGKYLASTSSDRTVIVWEVKADEGFVLKHRLAGHESSVSFVSWSPDNKQLLSCGVEEVVRRWDVDTGECLFIYRRQNVGMVSCGWSPDGKSVYAGVNDRRIIKWGLEGNVLQDMSELSTIEISDLGILNNEGPVLAVSKENAVISVDFVNPMVPNRNPRNVIVEVQPIVSFSLSEDRRYVLVNLLDARIHLWSIDGRSKLIGKYRGHSHHRFVVRSCFGGVNQGFVASGSEDSQVYIWLRKSGELITTLSGHTGIVNSVSWNPVNPHILASASDDGTIRIWGLKKMNNSEARNGDEKCLLGVVD